MPADAVQVARTLAANHPTSKLPCPVCTNSVNATNLDSHLAKVHADKPGSTPPWRGIDRRVVIPAAILSLLAVVGGVVAISSLGVKPGGPVAIALIVVMVIPAGIALAGLAGVLAAKVSVEDNAIVVRHALGLGRSRVQLPCSRIVSGPLYTSQSTSLTNNAEYNTPSIEIKNGSYLRLVSGRGGITFAAKGDSMFQHTWARGGWNAGGKRFWYDVKLSRDALVGLEYELASRGDLVPAPAHASAQA